MFRSSFSVLSGELVAMVAQIKRLQLMNRNINVLTIIICTEKRNEKLRLVRLQ